MKGKNGLARFTGNEAQGWRMRNEKGLVISLSTLLLFIVMVWFAAFYSEKVERQESNAMDSFAIEKAGFVADDIIFDVNRLLGAGFDVNRGTNFMAVKLNGKLPADVNRQQLLALEAFAEGGYAGRQQARIQLGFARLLDGATEMKFSNGLLYEHAYANDLNFVQFRKEGGSSPGVLTYDINLFVQGARLQSSVPWSCGSGGDVNVNLRYKDSYGESENSLGCKQGGSGSYSYSFAFVGIGGNLVVRFGNVDGNLNAVKITHANCQQVYLGFFYEPLRLFGLS